MSFSKRFVCLLLLVGPAVPASTLRFEENVGQVDPRVRFLCRTAEYTLYLTSTEAVFDFDRSGLDASMRVAFVGRSDDVVMRGAERLPGRTNYLIGRDPRNWRSGIESHGRVVYEDIYEGIDLVFRDHAGRVEFDFVLEPGADPTQIALEVDGADDVRLAPSGDLQLAASGGTLTMHPPVVYQELSGSRALVAGRFVVDPERRIRFSVGDYDLDRSLVIDPILSFSTYLGGEEGDEIRDLAVDGQGNTYVVGWTLSSNFPLASPLDGTLESQIDGFVSKVAANGETLIYSTYFGGDRDDNRNSASIAVNAAGEVFLAGETNGGTFPTTGGAYETDPQGVADCYVAKLSADGSTLLYSTILGGTSADRCYDIDVDSNGNAFVVGMTNGPGFPTTPGAFQENPTNAFSEAFVTKVNATGTDLVYSTLLGGSSHETGRGITLIENDVVLTGETSSADFPVASAFQGASGGLRDAFVTRLDATGSALVFSSYHGGSRSEWGYGIAGGDDGNFYVTGYTESTADMPVTAGVVQPTHGGSAEDAFVIKVGETGALVYSTYLGGSLADRGLAVAVRDGWARVTGETTSSNFPTAAPIQADQSSTVIPGDAFIATLSPDGSVLGFSTYLGGIGKENTRDQAGLGIGPDGAIHVAGVTDAEDFPTTAGTFQDADPDAGDNSVDGFVAKIHECDVTGLRFTSKTDFDWSATGLGQCGTLFDTARGELDALIASGGDFSTALCLEDDDADTTASDADAPVAGDGFWYLARVDGSTWDAAGTAGDRDATLTDCP